MDKFLIKKTNEEKNKSQKDQTMASIASTSAGVITGGNSSGIVLSETDSDDDDYDHRDVIDIKKKRARIEYSTTWAQIKDFEGWLKKSDKPNYLAYCSVCVLHLKASGGKTDIKKHSNTLAHKKNFSSVKIQSSVSENFNEFIGLKKQIIKAELHIAALTAEHNLSFLLSDHLIKMLQSAFSDSTICKGVTCNRKKTVAIIKNVLGAQQFENLADILKESKFSLCVDESTDLSTKKLLSLVVRVAINFKAHDFLFALIEITAADANSIYKEIVKAFRDAGIDYQKNMIGFAADGAATMTGKNHSVAVLLKKDCPQLLILKCICHSFALCSSYACHMLPSYVETLVREIYNYVSNSPKRTAEFENIIKLLDDKPKKLLHPVQTRWLSLEKVVIRIIELYDPLKIYFGMCYNVDKIDSAKGICQNLQKPITRLYLEFLKYILPTINKLTRVFQSEEPQIHKIHNEIKTLVCTIFDNFLDPEYLAIMNIENVDFKNSENHINIENIYLGTEVALLLETNNINVPEVEQFKYNCCKFYVELCDQIFKRFNFKNECYINLALLKPKKTIKKENVSLLKLFILFPNVINSNDLQEIDSEYREIRNLSFSEIFSDLNIEKITIQSFWKSICLLKRQGGELAFTKMSSFINAMLSLPHSSANVERIFSQINLNKTKTRNRLETITLEGILLTKDFLKFNNFSCYNIKICDKLMSKYNSKMYGFTCT